MKKISLLSGFLLFIVTINAQAILNNPSFEDEPSDASMPMGWFSCESNTTPDILPGPWGVMEEPYEGETYLGLITRVDGSFESIGQRLPERLEADMCYSFSFALNNSEMYNGYNDIINLKIWVGTKKCKKSQLIYESPPVDFDDWEEIKVKFTAEKKHKYIILEAYHNPKQNAKNGHILIDNISNITKCTKV